MNNHYGFSVLWSDEDGCFLALCSEFPGLSAFGDTPTEAVSEGMIALGLMLEQLREAGQEPPPPRTLEAYSGQFRVRLPKWLHASLVARAQAEDVSLNTLVVSYLSSVASQRPARIDESYRVGN